MVIRHPSRATAKTGQVGTAGVSQTLATELGDKGIHQQRRPRAISGTTSSKMVLSERSPKYGITTEQVYEQTASKSDLKRLPPRRLPAPPCSSRRTWRVRSPGTRWT